MKAFLDRLTLVGVALLLFVFYGAGAALIQVTLPDHVPSDVRAILAFASGCLGALLWAAAMMGTLHLTSYLRPKPNREEIEARAQRELQELADAGLVETIDYRARRAFEVEEYEDEGASYYIELLDGRVLALQGQHLYHYQIDHDQRRTFPTDDFSILRHKTTGQFLEMVVRGSVLEPEVTAPPFETWEPPEMPEDGTIYPAGSYEVLKAERLEKGIARD